MKYYLEEIPDSFLKNTWNPKMMIIMTLKLFLLLIFYFDYQQWQQGCFGFWSRCFSDFFLCIWNVSSSSASWRTKRLSLLLFCKSLFLSHKIRKNTETFSLFLIFHHDETSVIKNGRDEFLISWPRIWYRVCSFSQPKIKRATCVCVRGLVLLTLWGPIYILGTRLPYGDKSPLRKSFIFRVKTLFWVRFRKVVALVNIRVGLQEMNSSLCDVPKSDGNTYLCVFVCMK